MVSKRWDLKLVAYDYDKSELEALLNEGYEPFAITPRPQTQSIEDYVFRYVWLKKSYEGELPKE